MRQIGGGRCDTCGRLKGLRCDTCGRLGRLIALICVYMCEYVCICVYMCVNVCMCVNMCVYACICVYMCVYMCDTCGRLGGGVTRAADWRGEV